jgi:hypothetical protein
VISATGSGMATIQHETAHTYRPIAEYGGPSKWYAPFYGRGYTQLTHEFNYIAYSKKLGIDLVKNMKRVMEPDISLFIIIDPAFRRLTQGTR